MGRYSVLIKRVVNVRIENIDVGSPAGAARIAGTANFDALIIKRDRPKRRLRFIDYKSANNRRPQLAFVEDGGETIEYLVEAMDNPEHERSQRYTADLILVDQGENQEANSLASLLFSRLRKRKSLDS